MVLKPRHRVGNDHSSAATSCTNDGCLLGKLSNACMSYCATVGVFAALVDDDEAQARYGEVYGRFADLSAHCDSANAQAEAGAWNSVPFFLDVARGADGELEAMAQAVQRSVTVPPARISSPPSAVSTPCPRVTRFGVVRVAQGSEVRSRRDRVTRL